MLNTRFISVSLSVVIIVILICANVSAENNLESLNAQQWQEDLEYLANKAEQIHVDLYHTMSEESFDSAVTSISNDIPSSSTNQIVVRMAELVNAIGDGHTSLLLLEDRIPGFHQYPLNMYWFSDGWFVKGAMRGYEKTLGAKVLSIGGIPIDEIYNQLRRVLPHDNEWTQRYYSEFYITIPEILNGLGTIPEVEGVSIKLQDKSGTEFEVAPELLSFDELSAAKESGDFVYANDNADNPLPLWLKHPDKDFWFEYLPGQNVLYVQYRNITNSEEETFKDFSLRMLSEVDRLQVDKLIVDLRNNGGGNNTLNAPLIHGIIERPAINQEGKLFVITGRNTFSAASYLVTYLERHTNALFVGEPMGGSPNHFGDALYITLPNSGTRARFSTLYWQNSLPFDSRKVHGPDLSTPQTAEGYFSNIDTALNAILEYETEAPLLDRLVSAVSDGDYEKARTTLIDFINEPLHEYIDLESELNNLGYEYLGQKKIDMGVAILKLNTDAYPNRANPWDSYAEALAVKGDTTSSIASFQKSLELNPDNANAKEMIKRLSGK